MNISKELTNTLIVEGSKEQLKNCVACIEKNIKLISVQCPKNNGKISTEFINRRWQIKKYKLDEVVLFVKPNQHRIIFLFSNSNFEEILLKIVKVLSLNATYLYTIEDNNTVMVETEEYIEGTIIDEDEEFVARDGHIELMIIDEIKKFKNQKYSIAKCLN